MCTKKDSKVRQKDIMTEPTKVIQTEKATYFFNTSLNECMRTSEGRVLNKCGPDTKRESIDS